jgi:hypothetical protein
MHTKSEQACATFAQRAAAVIFCITSPCNLCCTKTRLHAYCPGHTSVTQQCYQATVLLDAKRGLRSAPLREDWRTEPPSPRAWCVRGPQWQAEGLIV